MFIIPIATDAPIYHRPIGTTLMIAMNVAVYLVCGFDSVATIDAYGLSHGAGYTPIQWVTSNFVHAGFFHLLFNMIFLWGFGIIVEGKVGWYHFIPIYLAIGVLECIIEQTFISEAVGQSFGASAIVFGVMVIALIWAPVNELTMFYWFFFRFMGIFDISIVMYSILTIIKSVLFYVVLGEIASYELLHLIGAGVGAAIAIVYMALRLVDCEGWDLFSVIKGRPSASDEYLSEQYRADLRRRQHATKSHRARPIEAVKTRNFLKGSKSRFFRLLDQKKMTAAHIELARIRQREPEFVPSAEQLLALARGLRRVSAMKSAVEIYEEFLRMHPNYSPACLEVAEILVYVDERPGAAKKYLERCNVNGLNESQTSRFEQAMQLAQSLIKQGIIEIDYQY